MSKLHEGVSRFYQKGNQENRTLFSELANGQSPHTLFITCSDSRIDPCLITDAKPGDLFVVRNAGNLVPAYGSGVHGESASIEYAVSALKVQNVVVCGHIGCGAMQALKDGVDGLPEVQGWLKLAIAPAGTADVNDYIKFNVIQQLENLRSYSFISDAEKEGTKLLGWVYDIGTGDILQLDESKGTFEKL